MSKYSKKVCAYCGAVITSAGYPYVNHMRRHVREGLVEERRRDTNLEFIETPKGFEQKNNFFQEVKK